LNPIQGVEMSAIAVLIETMTHDSAAGLADKLLNFKKHSFLLPPVSPRVVTYWADASIGYCGEATIELRHSSLTLFIQQQPGSRDARCVVVGSLASQPSGQAKKRTAHRFQRVGVNKEAVTLRSPRVGFVGAGGNEAD
jgi:hypothetical protein